MPLYRTTIALHRSKRHAHLSAVLNRAQQALGVMKQTWKYGIGLTYFSTLNKTRSLHRKKSGFNSLNRNRTLKREKLVRRCEKLVLIREKFVLRREKMVLRREKLVLRREKLARRLKNV